MSLFNRASKEIISNVKSEVKKEAGGILQPTLRFLGGILGVYLILSEQDKKEIREESKETVINNIIIFDKNGGAMNYEHRIN